MGILSFPVFLFVIGSIFHKMIGVQVLVTFQIILFTSTISINYIQPFILLNYLSSTTCNFLYLFNQQSNFYSKQLSLLSLFPFSESNLYISQVIIGGVILVCSIAPIVRLILRFLSEKKDEGAINTIVNSMSRAIYNHALFPFCIGFLFVNIFAYSSSSSYYNFQDSVVRIPIATLQLFLSVVTAFVFFNEWDYLFRTKLKVQ